MPVRCLPPLRTYASSAGHKALDRRPTSRPHRPTLQVHTRTAPSSAASARDYQPHPRHGGITGSQPKSRTITPSRWPSPGKTAPGRLSRRRTGPRRCAGGTNTRVRRRGEPPRDLDGVIETPAYPFGMTDLRCRCWPVSRLMWSWMMGTELVCCCDRECMGARERLPV